MVTSDDVLVALARHVGEANGIRAKDLAQQLGVHERQLRHLISQLIFERGVAIVGQPSTGYFIAKTPGEISRSVEFHRERALHELKKASVLSNVPLPELLGQLKLKT